jgi:outer membrane protein TolC
MKWFEVRPIPKRHLAVLLALGVQAAGAGAQEPTPVPQFLRLRDAIEIAVKGSTQLGIQQSRLDASRAASLNSWFNLGPDFTVNAFNSRSTRKDDAYVTPDSIVVPPSEEESDFRQLSADSRVRLFDGFANYYRVAAARSDVRANELDYLYTSTTVSTNVVAAYYELLRAKLLLTVAIESEQVSREQLQRTEALYELGSAARSDVLKSQVQLGQTRLVLVQARNRERLARDGLIYAMNLISATPFEIDTTVVQLEMQDADFDSEVRYAIDHRLDLFALRETENGESKRVVAAHGPLFPTIDFAYGYDDSRNESEFRFGSSKTRTRSWTVSSSWNVFDRFQTWSNISQAKANRRIAEHNRRQTELDAIREIRDLVNQIREAQERFEVARENVARSEEDLRLAQEKFRVGAGTILDTITAESDLTTTRAAEVEASVDYLIARANLARATGRPFSDL